MTSRITRWVNFLIISVNRTYLLIIPKAEVKLYVSTKGNDQYVLSPMKLPRAPLCEKANNDYRKFIMKELSTTSDLPSSDAADICPLFEKVIKYKPIMEKNAILPFLLFRKPITSKTTNLLQIRFRRSCRAAGTGYIF